MDVARRWFVARLPLALLAAPLVAAAQQAGKLYRIGWLSGASATSDPHNVEAFRHGLRDFGWIEGGNIAVEYRWAEGQADRLAGMAAQLVRLGVDVIVAPSPGPVFAAKNATSRIPIVMVFGPDPVELGLVSSLARPGGNITGLSTLSADLSAKQIELLKGLVPGVSRIGVLWNPTNPWHPSGLKGIEVTARATRIQLQLVAVADPAMLDRAFAAMATEHVGAVLVLADPMTFVQRSRIAALATTHRLPAMGALSEYAEAGALASYWPSSVESFRRAAGYVHKILTGVPAADLPIEQPAKFHFVINLRTAKALGLTIPASMLLRADQVIE